MIDAPRHIASDQLMAFARAEDPTAREFRPIAEHLDTGCEVCAAWLAGHKSTADWIQPRRVRARGNVRAGALADVSLLCNAGPYELDVLIRELHAPPSLAIAGQITQAERIHEPVPALELALVEPASCGVVMATTTNAFGEFDFPTMGEQHYGLRCGDATTAPVVLLWDGR